MLLFWIVVDHNLENLCTSISILPHQLRKTDSKVLINILEV